jgi:hypothetical protein
MANTSTPVAATVENNGFHHNRDPRHISTIEATLWFPVFLSASVTHGIGKNLARAINSAIFHREKSAANVISECVTRDTVLS